VLSRIEITPQIPNGLDAHAHTGALLSVTPGGPVNMNSLQQMAISHPGSMARSFSTLQGGWAWNASMVGAGLSTLFDGGRTIADTYSIE
jgi:hypothetical protein